MDNLLTKNRRAYVNRRKPDIIRGPAVNPNMAIAARYADELIEMVEAMVSETERELRALFEEPHAEEFFAQDATTASQARIITNRLLQKFNDAFALKAKPLSEKFTKRSDKASSSAVHGSLKELSGGLSLPTSVISPDMREVLKATITENVGLIKSIPQKYFQQVQGSVMRSITSGQGLKTLQPSLEKYRGITYKRARFIAYDQTRKAMNNLSRERMEKLGLQEWEWLHTGGGQHPRKHHIALSGKIFGFDNPPVINPDTGERGFPGQEPGCRCRMKAVIRFEK